MRTIWILVADAGRARIFSKADGEIGLTQIKAIDNPQGRAHNVDLVSDHPGRLQKGGTGVMSDLDPRTEPHEQKAIEFAHHLNHVLDTAAQHRAFDHMAIIAPAHFLGLLRAGLKNAVRQRLTLEQSHDLTRMSQAEVERHLHDALQFPIAAGT